jgi:hypothetical protein
MWGLPQAMWDIDPGNGWTACRLGCASTELACPAALEAAILVIHRCLAAGCRLNRRKKKPNTYKVLLDPVLASRA